MRYFPFFDADIANLIEKYGCGTQEVLETAYELFIKQSQYHDALRVALRMGNEDAIPALFAQCSEDKLMKKQMCLLLARQRINYEINDDDDDEATELNELIGNEKLSEEFLKVAQDLDVMDPKTPEDIYKSHLAETGGFSRRRDAGGVGVDSARSNLASTYVNAFVNAGFGQDKVCDTFNERSSTFCSPFSYDFIFTHQSL